jgi:hypothetical protein
MQLLTMSFFKSQHISTKNKTRARWTLIAPVFAPFLALIASCGGGSNETAAPTSPNAPSGGNLALTVVTPSSNNNALTVGQAIRVEAQAQISAANAPDGTIVQFDATGASASPPSAPTANGMAWTTLTLTTAGTQTLSVSMQVNNATATASIPVYVRPAPQKMGVLVPAYFYPNASGSDWDRLSSAASANPSVNITAILNPNNGVFTTVEIPYLQAAQRFVAAGGTVVGYVSTRYGRGSRSIDQVKANIDHYFDLYGTDIVSGIFLDEMGATADAVDFYRTLYQHIKAKGANLRVIGNPGAFTIASYADLADTLVTFEGPNSSWANYDPRTTAASWVYNRSNQSTAMLTHNTGTCANMQAAIQSAAQARANVGWVYATDLNYNVATGVGNPWAHLPSYWENLISTVDAINKASALPPCSS